MSFPASGFSSSLFKVVFFLYGLFVGEDFLSRHLPDFLPGISLLVMESLPRWDGH